MVGMGVGVEDRIQLGDLFPQCLLAKIRRGIDQYIPPVVGDHYRRTSTTIARVERMADGAVAAGRRNSDRRAAAEYRQSRLHQPFVPVLGPGACGGCARALVTST